MSSDHEPSVGATDFVHLHLHTEYSALDGGCRVKRLAAKAKELGMDALGISDHGTMSALPLFQEEMKKAGIKPILGIEIYLTEDRHIKNRQTTTWHLGLIAESTEGYQNLCRLSTRAYTEGFYSKPRADWELLERYSRGVIALTGCMAAPVMSELFKGNFAQAYANTERLISIFGRENVYGEIQDAGIDEVIPAASEVAHMLGKSILKPEDELRERTAALLERLIGRTLTEEQEALVQQMITDLRSDQDVCGYTQVAVPLKEALVPAADASEEEQGWRRRAFDEIRLAMGTASFSQHESNVILVENICKPLNIKPVATGDVHYINEEDADLHDILICIGTRATIDQPNRFSLLPQKYYMKSEQEMELLFSQWPEAMQNSREIADRCHAEIRFGRRMLPRFDVPEEFRFSLVDAEGYPLTNEKGEPEFQKHLERNIEPDHELYQNLAVRIGEDEDGRAKFNNLTDADGKPFEGVTLEEIEHHVRAKQLDGFIATAASRKYLRHLVEGGMDKRYGPEWRENEEQRERMEFELATFDSFDVNDYPLITWDWINWCHKQGIPVGPGRGSGAGSIVLYALGITQLCPLKYGLLFERFMNPDRKGLPDVDTDVSPKSRDRILEYLRDKYGKLAGTEYAISQIVTFGMIGAKSGIKDAARVLYGHEGQETANRLAKLIPDLVSLEKALEENKQLQNEHKPGTMAGTIIDAALGLDGFMRGEGIHAAGVVIYDRPLDDVIPLMQKPGKPMTTAYEMKYAEMVGALKIDVLGLRNLDIIARAIEIIEHTKGEKLDMYDIDLEDPGTYQMLARRESMGVFQFECVAGDTRIDLGNGTSRTIAELYEDHPTTLPSLDLVDVRIRQNDVLRVVQTGHKQLYKMTTISGYELRATPEHRVLTQMGWKKVGELTSSDAVVIDSLAVPRLTATRASHQSLCASGRVTGLKKVAIDGFDDLDLPSSFCLDPISKVECDVEEMTYDIMMKAPFNNYIANGIVVHNSGGMQNALGLIKPTELDDLIAIVALYRPGPMANIPVYAARKHKREEVVFEDPRLEDILGATQGIAVYQEQLMEMSKVLGGFTPGEADGLRKTISKKLRDEMEKLEVKFVEGCKNNGVSPDIARMLWKRDFEPAADYSFNKSHAACYAYISYVTAYLKHNYPHAYMAALLSSVADDSKKLPGYLAEAQRMGLKVLPPDVNRSLRDFSVFEAEGATNTTPEKEAYEILFGLEGVARVGGAVVDEIRAERDANGPFASIWDFARRMPKTNKTIMHQLVKAGAFDFTGETRKAMFDVVEDALAAAKKERDAKLAALISDVTERVLISRGLLKEEVAAEEDDIPDLFGALGMDGSGSGSADDEEKKKARAKAITAALKEIPKAEKSALQRISTCVFNGVAPDTSTESKLAAVETAEAALMADAKSTLRAETKKAELASMASTATKAGQLLEDLVARAEREIAEAQGAALPEQAESTEAEPEVEVAVKTGGKTISFRIDGGDGDAESKEASSQATNYEIDWDTLTQRWAHEAYQLIVTERPHLDAGDADVRADVVDRLYQTVVKTLVKAKALTPELYAKQGTLALERVYAKQPKENMARMEEKIDVQLQETKVERKQHAKKLVAEIMPVALEIKEAADEKAELESALRAKLIDPELSKEEWPELEMLNNERSVLGIYVSGHPLDANRTEWARYVAAGVGEIQPAHEGRRITVAGAITAVIPVVTKTGKTMKRMILDDLTGTTEITFFEDMLDSVTNEVMQVGNLVSLEADVREDTFTKNKQAEEADPDAVTDDEDLPMKLVPVQLRYWLPETVDQGPLRIHIPQSKANKTTLAVLDNILSGYPGEHPVVLVNDKGQQKESSHTVTVELALMHQLRRLLGSRNAVQ